MPLPISMLMGVMLLFGPCLRASERFVGPAKLYGFCMDMPKVRNPSVIAQAKLLQELGFDGVGYGLWMGETLDQNLRILDEVGLDLHLVYLRVNVNPAKPAFDDRVPEAMAKLKGRSVTVSVLLQGLTPGDPRGMEPAVKEGCTSIT